MKLPFYVFNIILLTLIFALNIQLLAQDASVMAQSQYFKAEEAYNNGNYTAALKALDKSEEYKGNNHLIQYLRVKSLYSNGDYIESKAAMSVFFKIIDPGLKNSAKYNEIVLLVAEIDDAIERKKVALEVGAIRQEKIANAKAKEAELLKSGFIDDRDGNTYKVVKIGSQIWMAENLNYKMNGAVAYNNDPQNARMYGLLYTWEAALQACPTGWHLPSDKEWNQMINHIGGESTAGKALKSTSGWKKSNGTNSSGFNAKPGGDRDNVGLFSSRGRYTAFWSSTQVDESFAWGQTLYPNWIKSVRYNILKTFGWSVRCLRDN